MRNGYKELISITLLLLFTLSLTAVASAAPKDSANSIVITFKDGHQQTYSLADIARIEFKSPASAAAEKGSGALEGPGRHHFVGKWAVGDGNGNTYYFTFAENGHATNDVGSGGQGAWTYVDGEARVSWDNGWHDIIRKVGTKYQKFAYSPGKSFSDNPYNVTDAHRTGNEPI
jgi:hypothetical protein